MKSSILIASFILVFTFGLTGNAASNQPMSIDSIDNQFSDRQDELSDPSLSQDHVIGTNKDDEAIDGKPDEKSDEDDDGGSFNGNTIYSN